MRDGEETLVEGEKTSHAARTLEVSLDRADNVIEGAPARLSRGDTRGLSALFPHVLDFRDQEDVVTEIFRSTTNNEHKKMNGCHIRQPLNPIMVRLTSV